MTTSNTAQQEPPLLSKTGNARDPRTSWLIA
uniref:Uncharacterized protein n=1 Tax=Arundo donax TaxID=35708 RepID=A0A0A9FEA3_ARUDO